MNIRVILIETEYSSNLGAVCRAMKNFGLSDLWLVNPRCEVRSVDAYKGAKHAKEILEGAKVVKSLSEAADGCQLLAGTTGIKIRNKNTIRGVMALRDFAKKASQYEGMRIGLVFGREGIGLNERELDECDVLLHIESSHRYPVLNLSHAAAIVFYALSPFAGHQEEKPASAAERATLRKIFASISSKFERKDKRAPVALRRIIARSHANQQEVRALLNLFRLVDEELGRKGKIGRGTAL